jgi:hypothetical protein
MRHFTTVELSRLAGTQTGAMQDICRILAYSAVSSDYGPATGQATYTAGSPVVCGYNPKPKEVQGDGQVMMTDGTLRLPSGTTISHLDRIRLTHRYGVALSPVETFEVLGQPARGPSGLVVYLRMVTDGT